MSGSQVRASGDPAEIWSCLLRSGRLRECILERSRTKRPRISGSGHCLPLDPARNQVQLLGHNLG
jgi:hypothetical protein